MLKIVSNSNSIVKISNKYNFLYKNKDKNKITRNQINLTNNK